MRTLSVAAVVILLTGVGYLVYMLVPPETVDAPGATHTYESDRYGVSFSYPDYYKLQEQDAPGSGLREHHAIVLIHKDNLPLPRNGDGPPTITIDIYQNNLDTQTTRSWIENTAASNFKLSSDGRLATTTIDSVSSLEYTWDGLYQGRTRAAAAHEWIYAFSVMYNDPNDRIVRDFDELLSTVDLTATSTAR